MALRPGNCARRAEVATSYTDVMTVRDTGRRTFFHQRGANAILAPEHFDFSGHPRPLLPPWLLAAAWTRSIAPGRRAAAGGGGARARARAAGLLTSVDCVSEAGARFRTHVAPVLPEVDVLFANDFEAEQLTGLHRRPRRCA